MRLVKKIKRDTKIVIISVAILTLTTLEVSYAAFFSIKSQSTVQEITTGTLNVTIDSSSARMSSDDMYPTETASLPTTDASVVSGTYARLNLTNSGTLNADFSVSISYDELPVGKTLNDLISFNYLIVGIYSEDDNSWVNLNPDTSSNPSYYLPVTSFTPSSENVYPIFASSINATASKQYRVYVWLSENTPITEIGKLVYLKLDVKSTVSEPVGS